MTQSFSTLAPFLRASGSTLSDFHKVCLSERAPGFFPLSFFTDDRGYSLMNLFVGVLAGGQVNYSCQYPGIVKAWHRHQKQTDFWCVTQGTARVAVMDSSSDRRWEVFVGEKAPAIVIIPPDLWHGIQTIGHETLGLLYYLTEEYNPNTPDEERQPADWQWNPWIIRQC